MNESEQNYIYNMSFMDKNAPTIQDAQNNEVWNSNYWQVKDKPTKSTCTLHGRQYQCEEVETK